jgi:SipA vinculin binding site
MKKLLQLSALFICLFSFSQVPQGISYQAIALNASGNPIVSSPVGIRLSVLDISATGTALYTETHTKTTNAQGLFNLVIGQGTPSSGTFSTINWGSDSKFLKVEMDAGGGTNYVEIGTTQLLSVPYAMYAGNAGNVVNSTNSISFKNNVGNGNIVVYGAGGAEAFNGTSWIYTSLSNVIGATASNSNIAVYGANGAEAFNGTSWIYTSLSNVIGATASNSRIVVYGSGGAEAFNGTSWVYTSLSNVIGATASNNNIVVYGTNGAQAFNGTSWVSTSLSNVIGASASGNNIVVYGAGGAEAFNGTSWIYTSLSNVIGASGAN